MASILPADPTLDEIRAALAPLIAQNAAFDGFGDAALAAAAERLRIDPAVARLAFPGGGRDMVDAWFADVDASMATKCPAEKLAEMKIRARIVTLVETRLELLVPYRESLRRALALLANLRAAERPDVETAGAAPAIVVCGTDTDAGKTVAAAVLVRGLGARYWKPVQTGDDCDTATVHRLAALDEADWLEPAARFALPASPHEAAAAEGGRVPPEELAPRLAAHAAADPRPLVVELAGGLEVPLTDDVTQLDHLAAHPRPLVLVARSGLGTLNHTLLSLAAARARGLEVRALLLVGPPHPSNRATLERLGRVPRVLELPRLDPLDTPSIDAWHLRNDLSGILPGD